MWPNVPCGPQTAGQILDEIRDLAFATLLPGPLRQRVLAAVEACRSNHCLFTMNPPLDINDHCMMVMWAHSLAIMGNWDECSHELEHGQ